MNGEEAMLPLYMKDVFGFDSGLVWGLLLGMSFGFVLERSGFGQARVLSAQFYLRDMRVLKVMFSAIVTATLGLAALGAVGAVDLSAVHVPDTWMVGQAVGGLILGAGFIISGYCPGTSVVATASGNLDGLATLGGVVVGSLLFGVTRPLLGTWPEAGGLGLLTWMDLLALPRPIIVAAVVLIAVGAFLFAEWIERWSARRGATNERSKIGPLQTETVRRRRVGGGRRIASLGFFAASLAVVAAWVSPLSQTRARAHVSQAPVSVSTLSPMTPLALAKGWVTDNTRYYVLDMRPGAQCLQHSIPGALCVAPGSTASAVIDSLPATRTLVLFDERGDADGAPRLSPSILARFGTRVAWLVGGHRAFHALVHEPPTPPRAATPQATAEFLLRKELVAYFGGVRVAGSVPKVQPVRVRRAPKKKGGGC